MGQASIDHVRVNWFICAMKVICLVPSWTETLIECGVNVVGRTRFCIHPQEKVKNIPVVGGTKDLDWEKVHSLGADLLVVDQEENLPWMKEDSPIPVHVTHVESLQCMAREMTRFAEILPLQAAQFLELKERWSRQLSKGPRVWDFQKIPAVMDQWGEFGHVTKLVYVIWKKPWMSVSPNTWIGSILTYLGAKSFLIEAPKKYPSFELKDFELKETFFLFSSEPFPFHKQISELKALNVSGAVVDGESYSWFGIRSLRFLEELDSQ